MIGLGVVTAGFVLVCVGLVVVLGPWVLAPAGGVLILVGLFADLDRLKEPQRAKRHQSAP